MDEKAQSTASLNKDDSDAYNDEQEVYWMDVMIEHGWETTMA